MLDKGRQTTVVLGPQHHVPTIRHGCMYLSSPAPRQIAQVWWLAPFWRVTSGVDLPSLAEVFVCMAHDPVDAEVDRCAERVCAGDAAAFEPIVRRFQQPLRAWLAAQAPPGVDADEVGQRAFVEAFTRMAEYEPGTNFGGWLFTIAAFQLRTETTRRRRVAHYHARIAPELFQRALERQETPPEIWGTRLDHLQACLAALAAPLRQFVAWRYDACMPLEEMAARSGRSVAAVKKQLWSIRQSLKLCVEGRLAAGGGEA